MGFRLLGFRGGGWGLGFRLLGFGGGRWGLGLRFQCSPLSPLSIRDPHIQGSEGRGVITQGSALRHVV